MHNRKLQKIQLNNYKLNHNMEHVCKPVQLCFIVRAKISMFSYKILTKKILKCITLK